MYSISCYKEHLNFENTLYNSSLFNDFVCKLGLFGMSGPRVPKRPNLHKNELNTKNFCSTSSLKAPNRLKSLKLA
jgi:hypothetical protein